VIFGVVFDITQLLSNPRLKMQQGIRTQKQKFNAAFVALYNQV